LRKLIVKRKKQIVASAVKVRVCIKTEEAGDLHFKDVNLKLLGKLKNGKELVVDIPQTAVDIYVVFDKLLPQKFHAKYHVEAGETSETLHTFSRFNPFKGNPFMISKNEVLTSDDKRRIQQDESKTSKNLKVLYWIIIIVSAIGGYFLGMSLVS